MIPTAKPGHTVSVRRLLPRSDDVNPAARATVRLGDMYASSQMPQSAAVTAAGCATDATTNTNRHTNAAILV